MEIFVCLTFGAFIGWIASVLMRTDSSEGILIDIACGALGAIVLALALGNTAIFDNLVAGYLGSLGGLAVLHLIRRAGRDSSVGRSE